VVCENDERSKKGISRTMKEEKSGFKKEKIKEEEKIDFDDDQERSELGETDDSQE
jgi:hypothetical protein